MKEFIGYLVAFIMFCAVVYGCYWIAKKTSYFFFYESFVQETVREMVKQEALKGIHDQIRKARSRDQVARQALGAASVAADSEG